MSRPSYGFPPGSASNTENLPQAISSRSPVSKGSAGSTAVGMYGYDGFGTAQSPDEYLSAPALIMNVSHTPVAPVISTALEAASRFEVLNETDVRALESECTMLNTRIEELKEKLNREHKMKEAAFSLSKLHINGGAAPQSPEPKEDRRLSRIFGSSSERSKSSNKRLSRQAEEEAQVSAARIAHMEQSKAELLQRKNAIDRTILQHHAAVLALAAQGRPIPEVRPSGGLGSGGYRHLRSASWQSKGSRGHSRGSSFSSTMGSTILTQKEFPGVPASLPEHNEEPELNFEVGELVSQVGSALPHLSPEQNKVTYLRIAFQYLWDQSLKVDALEAQARTADERLRHLTQELRQKSNSSNDGRDAQLKAEIEHLRHDLNIEHARSSELKKRFEAQRQEFSEVTASLEDVTRVAVGYESERSEYAALLNQLEQKVAHLESERGDLKAKAMQASDTGSSILCKEFQHIIRDLHDRHYREMRDLRQHRLSGRPAAAISPLTQTSSSQLQSHYGPREDDQASQNDAETRKSPTSSMYPSESASAGELTHRISHSVRHDDGADDDIL